MTVLSDTEQISEHIRYLTSLGSRVTGYPGYEEAITYIHQKFKEYGAEASYDLYQILVPVDYGANITVLLSESKLIRAYPLWPNSIQLCVTPPGGIRGYLIYAGTGTLPEFDGKDVEGSIVLMEFNSKDNWINAAKLGARAVIFIEPEFTSRVECSLKYRSDIPINFPRLFVHESDGRYLLELLKKEDVPIIISVEMKWEKKNVANVIGLVRGTTYPDEIVIVGAPFDSWSVVPSLAPGATNALKTAVLLELARFLMEHPPKRSVMLVAFSGSEQGLAGAREFVNKRINWIGDKARLFISLDIDTETTNLAMWWRGDLYYRFISSILYGWLSSKVFKYLDLINKQLNKHLSIIDIGMPTAEAPTGIYFEPAPMPYESETFALAGGAGMALHTTNSLRLALNTPFDTINRINFENLEPQLELISGIIWGFGNEEKILPDVVLGPSRLAFTTLKGRVVQYNLTSGWYDSVPYALVRISAGILLPELRIITTADESGDFTVKGLASTSSAPGYSAQVPYFAEAYVTNKTTGAIEKATDLGAYGAAVWPVSFVQDREENFIQIPVFDCGGILLYDIFNPQSLSLVPNLVWQINDFRLHGYPIFYGVKGTIEGYEALIFVPPYVPIEIIMRIPGEQSPLAILINASKDNPGGTGFIVKKGETLSLSFTALRVANDLYWLNEGRLNILHDYRVFSYSAEDYHNEASILMGAIGNFNSKNYSLAFSRAVSSWSYDRMAYSSTMGLVWDTISTIVFFFLALLSFAFLAEKLFISSEGGYRRILGIVGIFILCSAALYIFHPGFHVASNAPMIALGFAIAVLSVPVMVLVYQTAISLLEEFRIKTMGRHVIEISRVSAAAMAFSTGIQQMRKRKLRTGLTLTSLILITTSLVALTSASTINIIIRHAVEGETLYNGILIRKEPWGPMPPQMLDNILITYSKEAIAAPRTWILPPLQRLSIGNNVSIEAFLGLSPEEALVTGLDRTLVEGRWFDKWDRDVAIISDVMAGKLNATTGSVIKFWGLKLHVIGIFSSKALNNIVDLDQQSTTPLLYPVTPAHGLTPSPVSPAVQQAQAQLIPHCSSEYVVLIPYKLAEDLGHFYPYSIAVKFKNPEDTFKHALSLSERVYTNVYAGYEGSIFIFRPMGQLAISGLQFLIVPLIIVGFAVLNIMLGAISERLKEIAIFGAVGLSPLHVVTIFLAESLVHAMMSGMLGYIFGLVGISVLYNLGSLGAAFRPNFSSVFIILSVGICILAVIASSVYPLFKVSKVVTPSIERKWRMPTKPRGDEWFIPLPFTPGADEASGLLVFLREYFLAFDMERPSGVFSIGRLGYKLKEEEGSKALSLSGVARLAPFEMGVSQNVNINVIIPKGGGSRVEIQVIRLTGPVETWIRNVPRFVGELRKQILVWRGLKFEERMTYIKRAQEEFGR